MSSVGREIRRLRTERGWSQSQLAVYAGSSQPTVNLLETGRRNPSAATLEKLASALSVEVADLFPKVEVPLPFEEGSWQRRDGDVDQDSWASTIDSWTCHMRLRAESWKRELGFWDDLSEDLPGLARWFEVVESEANSLLAAAERTLWCGVGSESGPSVASALAEHLEASREVDAAAQRVSERVWSAVEPHYPGVPNNDWGTRFGGLREVAQLAAKERGKLMQRIEERQRRSA